MMREFSVVIEKGEDGYFVATVPVKGSHHFLRYPDGRCTVVPVHRGETIGRGLLAQILRDCELSSDELREKL